MNSQLLFACGMCDHTEDAEGNNCVWRNDLNNTVGETAGITQDVAADPSVGASDQPFTTQYNSSASALSPTAPASRSSVATMAAVYSGVKNGQHHTGLRTGTGKDVFPAKTGASPADDDEPLCQHCGDFLIDLSNPNVAITDEDAYMSDPGDLDELDGDDNSMSDDIPDADEPEYNPEFLYRVASQNPENKKRLDALASQGLEDNDLLFTLAAEEFKAMLPDVETAMKWMNEETEITGDQADRLRNGLGWSL